MKLKNPCGVRENRTFEMLYRYINRYINRYSALSSPFLTRRGKRIIIGNAYKRKKLDERRVSIVGDLTSLK